MGEEEERRTVVEQVADLASHGQKFERAVDAVLAGGVKECRFLPSGRRVLSVVGKLGDELIDPEKPYCSCGDFFFRVKRGREEVCYHLLSYRIAARTGRVDIVEFQDEEYGDYLSAIVSDIFEVLSKSN